MASLNGTSGPQKTGRPSKRTPATRGRILELVREGLSLKAAALGARVSYSTLMAWQAQEPGFASELEWAENDAICEQVGLIKRAARKGSWQAAAWLLERRHPDQFARPAPVVSMTQIN